MWAGAAERESQANTVSALGLGAALSCLHTTASCEARMETLRSWVLQAVLAVLRL